MVWGTPQQLFHLRWKTKEAFAWPARVPENKLKWEANTQGGEMNINIIIIYLADGVIALAMHAV